MKIEILGTGCPKCKTLTNLVGQVVAENNIEAIVSKVEDIKTIMSYGVMSTPALAIDGKIVIYGRVPSIDELKKVIITNKSSAKCDSGESSNCSCSGGCC